MSSCCVGSVHARVVPWSEVEVVGWDRIAVSTAYAPALAVRLRSGQTVKGGGTWGFSASSRERLLTTVKEYARANDVRVEVCEEDLYFGFKRVRRAHGELTDFPQHP